MWSVDKAVSLYTLLCGGLDLLTITAGVPPFRFIVVFMDHVAAANQAFLVNDDDDLLTRDLVERITATMAEWARLVPIPVRKLTLAISLLGKPAWLSTYAIRYRSI